MNHKTYINHNTICRNLVKACSVNYAQQFSYKGPKVTRTKFWCLHGTNKKDIKKAIFLLEHFSFVNKVKHNNAGHDLNRYSSPSSITIYYK